MRLVTFELTKINKQGINVNVFRHNAARVTVNPLGESGLFEVCYLGPIGQEAFASLRDQALDATIGATGLVLRMEKALLTVDSLEQPKTQAYARNPVPAAMVARDDQRVMLASYYLGLRDSGVLRALFPVGAVDHSIRWTQEHAGIALTK